MINVREYQNKDYEQVKELSEIHCLKLPAAGHCLVAAEDDGTIMGFTIIRNVPVIEPFICTNPLIAKKLWDAVLLTQQNTIIRANILSTDKKLLEKLGFEEVFKGQIQMQKLK
jgi:hypothetical protein